MSEKAPRYNGETVFFPEKGEVKASIYRACTLWVERMHAVVTL